MPFMQAGNIKTVELVRMDERSGNLYVLAGESLDFEVKPTGGYEP
jgi:hypothetical protein